MQQRGKIMECENCCYYNLPDCSEKKCPCVKETWIRIKELDLKDENGLVIRYTMRNSKGEEKYIYWNDLFKKIYSE